MTKSIPFIVFITLVSCSGIKQEDNTDDYYSTEVDTSYSYTDRTEIDGITRTIYNKHKSSSFSGDNIRYVSLSNKSYSRYASHKTDNSFMIFVMDNDSEPITLHFINENELLDFFSKVDSLKVGEELNERKKTKHYSISKGEDEILVKQWSILWSDWSDEIKFSTIEYSGIKDAYTKFLNEKN